jgi:hypothetical protein
MHPDVPHFIILFCLMPDDFTRQGECAATQWVKIARQNCNITIHPNAHQTLLPNPPSQ